MRVRFGEFILDSETRELLRNGKAESLSPKGFQLLETLLGSRPRLLSKSQLHDVLWPRTFVSRTSLPRLVTEVRQALGDAPETPQFVRTVRSLGYAFCGIAVDVERRGVDAAAVRLLWGDREIELPEGEHLIGRAPECLVRVPSPRVSRRHARLVVTQGHVVLEDLGSRNGTHLRGRRIAGPESLAHGDEICVGPAVLTFVMGSDLSSTQTG